ncbi:odorant-binding protein 2b-like isoform X2 [Octodon degus]|uniref:Odorant-binding protein 2b-like isoform X2 n=1 Tax=Octodon degus TaxID=10160 RepID=A0A6P6D9A9_OCTDE|nr:odorant-binding protein 2b-like isoform X2 [Octodon degus]XP_023556229.1 odorant-binding protein 2b-like isoform X2 [Octodon degus]
MKPKKSFPVTVTALGDGGYEIQFTFFYKNKCQQKIIDVEKTSDPKKFKTSQDMMVTMEEMPVKGHRIFYIEHQVFGMTVRIAKLISRKPEDNPEAMREFKKFMKSKKLPVEYMVVPKQLKNCVS